jgi:hypothetical protein
MNEAILIIQPKQVIKRSKGANWILWRVSEWLWGRSDYPVVRLSPRDLLRCIDHGDTFKPVADWTNLDSL